MRHRSRWAQFGLVAALAVFCTGCGPSWKINEQVEGTAKLDGEPLANVMIEFTPDLGTKVQAPISRGVTDEKGHFVLMFDNSKPGAVIGKHNVVVRVGRGDQPEDGGKAVPEKRKAVPAVYSMAAETPLKLEVTADKHSYDLTLMAKAGAGTKTKRDP